MWGKFVFSRPGGGIGHIGQAIHGGRRRRQSGPLGGRRNHRGRRGRGRRCVDQVLLVDDEAGMRFCLRFYFFLAPVFGSSQNVTVSPRDEYISKNHELVSSCVDPQSILAKNFPDFFSCSNGWLTVFARDFSLVCVRLLRRVRVMLPPKRPV